MQPDKNQPGSVGVTKETQSTDKLEKATEAVEKEPQAMGSAAPTKPAPTATPPVISNQQPVVQASTVAAVQPSSVDSSLAQLPAEDADVIEKVWVEKADEIETTKKDDPYVEDEAQHNLSRAYLKKRFNLDVS